MTLWEIFWFFFRISSVTFGGGVALVGMIRTEAETRKLMDSEELADLMGLASAMPGPIGVLGAYALGFKVRGWRGALVGALGIVVPPFLIVLFLSPLVLKYSDIPAVAGFFKGVLAGVGAIIALMVARDLNKTLRILWNWVPFAAALIIISALKLHPLWAIVAVLALQYGKRTIEGRFAR